jgi:hypothetical protein
MKNYNKFYFPKNHYALIFYGIGKTHIHGPVNAGKRELTFNLTQVSRDEIDEDNRNYRSEQP